ncbi:DUF6541 family protein, partial [Motilibacter deserti]
LLGALMGLAAWLPAFRDGLPPQGNDDVWHGYATERLLHLTHFGISDLIPVVTTPGSPIVPYPYGVHLGGAAAAALTPGGVPTALNGLWAIAAGVTLPLGLAALAWLVFPGRPTVALLAGLLAPTINVFPYALNGVLPYGVTLSLVPGFLALLIARARYRRVGWAPVGLAAFGIFISHPAAAVAAAVVGVLVVGEAVLRGPVRELGARVARLVPAGVLAGLLALPWLRGSEEGAPAVPAAVTAAQYSTAQALRQLLGLQSPWTPAQPLLGALVVVGAVTLAFWLRRGYGILAAYAFFGVVFVGTLAGSGLISRFTVFWYGDWHRTYAVAVMLAPILAAAGLVGLAGLARAVEFRLHPRGLGARVLTAATVLVALVFALEGARYVVRGQSTVETTYGSGLVTAQDIDLMHRLADDMGPDEVALNYWLDGSSWMYAVAGVRPAVPYINAEQIVPDIAVLQRPGTAAADPQVCRVMLEAHATHAYAGDRLIDGSPSGFLQELEGNPTLFPEIGRTATSAIFRIDQDGLRRCAALAGP